MLPCLPQPGFGEQHLFLFVRCPAFSAQSLSLTPPIFTVPTLLVSAPAHPSSQRRAPVSRLIARLRTNRRPFNSGINNAAVCYITNIFKTCSADFCPGNSQLRLLPLPPALAQAPRRPPPQPLKSPVPRRLWPSSYHSSRLSSPLRASPSGAPLRCNRP
jgi:hypothetical protein